MWDLQYWISLKYSCISFITSTQYDCSAKLLFTDSLRYEIHGKMKDKTHGIPIQEFISLRPKMYSILYTENNKLVEKMAKGIKKSVTKMNLRHDNYKTCLFYKKQTKASMNQIRSNGHEIYSIALSLMFHFRRRLIAYQLMNTIKLTYKMSNKSHIWWVYKNGVIYCALK